MYIDIHKIVLFLLLNLYTFSHTVFVNMKFISFHSTFIFNQFVSTRKENEIV